MFGAGPLRRCPRSAAAWAERAGARSRSGCRRRSPRPPAAQIRLVDEGLEAPRASEAAARFGHPGALLEETAVEIGGGARCLEGAARLPQAPLASASLSETGPRPSCEGGAAGGDLGFAPLGGGQARRTASRAWRACRAASMACVSLAAALRAAACAASAWPAGDRPRRVSGRVALEIAEAVLLGEARRRPRRASAAVVKPSQRHRSPSRETSRWPA